MASGASSKRRNATRPLYPVDFVDLLFQREGNPFLFRKEGLAADEKPLSNFLWWHTGYLINKILQDGCTPKFVMSYFAPFINRETRECMLEPINFDLLSLLQYKWSFVCSTVASDLLASSVGEKTSDETMHLRHLFRLRRTTMFQLTGAVYEVLGWVAFHSGMRMQAELMWKCGADSGHPGCLVWLAFQLPPADNQPDQHVCRDPKEEAEEALRFIHAARKLKRPVPYQDDYMRILSQIFAKYESSETPADDDPTPSGEEQITE